VLPAELTENFVISPAVSRFQSTALRARCTTALLELNSYEVGTKHREHSVTIEAIGIRQDAGKQTKDCVRRRQWAQDCRRDNWSARYQ
jgi:hypothetical protein